MKNVNKTFTRSKSKYFIFMTTIYRLDLKETIITLRSKLRNRETRLIINLKKSADLKLW